jgi:hypothetical protein
MPQPYSNDLRLGVLRVAIDDAFRLLGPDNALAMFESCGYTFSRIR